MGIKILDLLAIISIVYTFVLVVQSIRYLPREMEKDITYIVAFGLLWALGRLVVMV